ncbi:XRE family transcriptional regulator [Streptomyces sp. NPDC094437]|uniref:nSTAND1 domain-containing NTPase n=1 Tax=Streptomyces sp. NPDC094437 TaxID=3366060 RepID=UPI0037F227C9
MARGERPLAAGDGVPLRLAAELRALRQKAGGPTYRELARISHYSVAALSSAAAGTRLPSLAVTLAYATACGADRVEWERHWHALAAEHARETGPAAGPEGAAGDAVPYAGLAEFRAEDADRFFGRERLIEEVAQRLRDSRFVTVVGASGAGKSSLLRAGVVPHWRRAYPQWPTVMFTPGPSPLEEAAIACAEAAGRSPGALARDLADSPRALHRAVRHALAGQPDEAEALLVVDQFEELFTLCHDPAERARFIDALVTAAGAENSRCRVVVGVRADFYAHCTAHAGLARAMSDAQLPVGPMTTDELRRAITRPAVNAGYQVEGALVAELVSQTQGQAAVLPMLSHALLETWRRRRGTTLTLAGYHATGGIDGALAHTAETLYADLSPRQQEAARALLLRLTALGEGAEDTKRRITRAELAPCPDTVSAPAGSALAVPPDQRDAHAADTALVLERLARERLVTLDRTSIEITHEVLIRCWPRLRGWLLDDREGQRIHRALTEAAHAWESVRRDPGALYRGIRLASAHQWAAGQHGGARHARAAGDREGGGDQERGASSDAGARDDRTNATPSRAGSLSRRRRTTPPPAATLSARERAFLHASLAARAAEERAALRGTRRLRQLTWLLAFLLLCTATATGFAVLAQHRAADERDTAVSQRIAEQAAALRPTDPAAALQLALSAYRLHPTVAARGALLSGYATPYATRLVGSDRLDRVALRPDGHVLATAVRGHAVHLWDVTAPHRPRPLATLAGRPGEVRSMRFSPDGRLLAAAGADGRARVWDVATPSRVDAPAVLKGTGPTVVFAPDSRTLATARGDHAVRLWHAARRCRATPAVTPAGVLTGEAERPDSLAFTPDGHILAVGGTHGIALWTLADPIPAPGGGEREPCDAPRPRAAGTAPGTAAAPPAPSTPSTPVTRTPVTTLPVRVLALSPDGRTLASAGNDQAVRLWDVEGPGAPRPSAKLTGHTDTVLALDFSPDGRTLASGASDTRVRLWDLTDRTHARPLTVLNGHTGGVTSLAFGPGGHTLASSGDIDLTARLWELPGPVLLGHTNSLHGVAFSPDGHTVATGGDDSTVRLWDTTDPYRPAPRSLLTGHTAAVDDVAFAPDGHTLASASLDRTVRLWDTARGGTPRLLARLAGHPGAVHTVAFQPKGTLLAAGGTTVRLWDTADPAHPHAVATVAGHDGPVESVAFSADGRVLATGGADHTVRLWDTARPTAPRPLATLTAHHHGVKAVAFSPRGHLLATTGYDRTVRLWDVTDPTAPVQLAAPGGYTDAVRALAFSPDGRTLATASPDRPVRLWNLADPRHPTELAVLTGHTKPVDALAFAPDGHTLVTAAEDATALVWDLDADRVAERICRTTGHPGLSPAAARRFVPGLPYRPPC